jgi:hypothetical protein
MQTRILALACEINWLQQAHLYTIYFDSGNDFEIFISCTVISYFHSLVQSLLVFVRPIKFAVLFTFGNIMAVGR